jgi:hypothetical protein
MSSHIDPARFGAFAALCLGTACLTLSTAQYQAVTAGAIGCPSNEITITSKKRTFAAGEIPQWSAECRGRRFLCSHSGASQCKEELQPAASAEPSLPSGSVGPSSPAGTAPRP